MKKFVEKLSPVDRSVKSLDDTLVSHCLLSEQGVEFDYYTTETYKLNFFETANNIKFVLATSLSVGDIRDALFALYSQVCEHRKRESLRRVHAALDLCRLRDHDSQAKQERFV